MKTRIMICAVLTCAASTCAIAPPAAAQATSLRTFVSGLGNDTGNCARSTPCRSFAYAINQTSAGGEVLALDPAGYGSVTITKAISLTGPGPGLAQITVPSGGTGITINAGSGDTVILSNLEIDGSGVGGTGISANTAGSVQITDSTVTGMAQNGINIQSTTASVTGSLVANNGNSDITANATGSTLVSGDVIVGASVGILAGQPGSTVVVAGCNVSGSSTYGVEFISDNTASAKSTNAKSTNVVANNGVIGFVKRSMVTGAGSAGLFVGFSTVYLDTATITGNATGVTNLGGTVNSYGNNNIAGNTTDTSGGAITPVKPN